MTRNPSNPDRPGDTPSTTPVNPHAGAGAGPVRTEPVDRTIDRHDIDDRIRVRSDAIHDVYPHELGSMGGVGGVRGMMVPKRVSWGAVFCGLFTALSTMIVLTVLGIAIGLTASGADTALSDIGIGAGIWGGLSALISFFVGGWMAAWSRPTIQEGNGMLQGALVWMVAVVLLFYGVASGIGSALGVAGEAAQTGTQAAATQTQGQSSQDLGQQAERAAAEVESQVNQMQQNITPRDVEQATDTAAGGAWGTLLALLLGLGAALVGGLVGAKTGPYRNPDRRDD